MGKSLEAPKTRQGVSRLAPWPRRGHVEPVRLVLAKFLDHFAFVVCFNFKGRGTGVGIRGKQNDSRLPPYLMQKPLPSALQPPFAVSHKRAPETPITLHPTFLPLPLPP